MKQAFAMLLTVGCVLGAQLFDVKIATDVPALDNIYGAVDDIKNLTSIQYNEILAGVVMGVINKNDDAAIQSCIHNAKTDATEVYAAYKECQTDLTGGLISMLKAVKDIKNLTSNCTGMKADVAELEAWLTVIATQSDIPAFIKAGVTHNLLKLTRKLATAKSQWSNGKYFAFGETCGEMLVIATTP